MWFIVIHLSLSLFAAIRLVFSTDFGLISSFVTIVNVAGVGGVFRLDESVIAIRLGVVFGCKRLLSTLAVVGGVVVNWLKYFVIMFYFLFDY